jgi:hypothetical protein
MTGIFQFFDGKVNDFLKKCVVLRIDFIKNAFYIY